MKLHLNRPMPLPRTLRLAFHICFSLAVLAVASYHTYEQWGRPGDFRFPASVEERLLTQVEDHWGAIGQALEAASPPHDMRVDTGNPQATLQALLAYPHVTRAFHCTADNRLTLLEATALGTKLTRIDLAEWRPKFELPGFRPQSLDLDTRRREVFISTLLRHFAFRGDRPKFEHTWDTYSVFTRGNRQAGYVGYQVDTVALANETFDRVLTPVGLNGMVEPVANEQGYAYDRTFRVKGGPFKRFGHVEAQPTHFGLTMTQLEVVQDAWKILGLLGLLLLLGVMAAVREVRGILHERTLALAQSNFVSGVSHEMRTPLTTIKMYAEMMEQGIVDAPEKRGTYLRTIGQEADRLTRLVENVLDYSKLSADRRPLHRQRFRLIEAVDEARASVDSLLVETSMDVEVDVNPMLELVADRDAVVQVLVNLMTNAAKYAADGKLVWVSAAEVGDAVHLIVKDFGPGIPRGETGKVFRPFYRVGNELTRRAKGTGLGLALVEAYVKAHEGSIQLDSKPGEGTQFRITMPKGGPTA